MKAIRLDCNLKAVLLLLVVIAVSCSSGDKKLTVTNLRCEYLKNPAGVDIRTPRFSWNIISEERGFLQSSYRIIVSDNPGSLNKETGNIWDSGRINSDEMNNIAFNGAPLKSGSEYWWSLMIWDQNGAQSCWSEPAYFTTGLLNNSDWSARWISAGDTLAEAPLLRKEFIVEKRIMKAFAYVTGAGYFELYLNGEKVGDHVLDPGMTDYSKRILYATFDLTKNLKKGTNAAGAVLGNGAFNLKMIKNRYSWGSKPSRPAMVPRFLMQIEITFRDGTTQRIITDDSWRSTDSPVTFNNIYGGEDYDARLEKPGWAAVDFDASGWDQVKITKSPGGILQSQLIPPVRVTATLKPIAETGVKDSVFLFDMGQNYAGWWRIKVEGEEGVKLRIRGAETLNDSLFPKLLEQGDRLSTKDRFHANVWTDYILKGKGTEVYEPRFFYTGIRYIEIATDDPGKLKMAMAEGRVVGTDFERNGTFITSDSLLNRIHRATIWAQKGNTHSYPTDCPHREKGGYTGDGQIVAEASIHDFQMAAFYTKWLNDMRDAQEENGRIPNTAPTLVGGMGGGVAWGSAYILIPWWMYQYYNDTRIMEQHYETMKKYLDYLHNLARSDSNPDEPYIINDFASYWYSLGEWCAPGQSDCPNHPMVNTCYYYINSMLMSKIASALGNRTDALRYSALADTIKEEINKKFFNQTTYNYGTDYTYQTYQLLVLAGNIVPDGFREQVLKTVLDDIVITRSGHLNTGIIGTKYLWPVLAHAGRSDLAYSIIKTTTYPGYGYWIMNGATTLLEQWNGRNSHNHQMFGSVDEYFYKYLAGMRSPEDEETTRGYKHIHIQPYVPGTLSFIEASINTIAGRIESHWQKNTDSFSLNVVIPPNSTASVSIDMLDYADVLVTESGKMIWENNTFIRGTPGITDGTANGNLLTFRTGSGTYKFVLSGKSRI
jgi:alpha-L-rhamnosidase